MVLACEVPVRGDMGVYRFEDLRVWQAAKQQCDYVGGLLKRPEFRRDLKLSDQIAKMLRRWQGTRDADEPRLSGTKRLGPED